MLDSIMLFWVLISLDLLLDGRGGLSRVALSGVCFGIALLSKETAIFLLPAMLLIAFQERRRHQGRFAVIGWLLPMLMVASFYPLYALLKGELLPASDASHVSLLEALLAGYARRRRNVQPGQPFWQLLRGDWLPRDPVLILGGAVAIAVNLLRGLRDRRALAAGLLGLLPLYYLARGGLVLDFYILFAIPFLCLNSPGADAAARAAAPAAAAGLGGVAALALVVGWWSGGLLRPLYSERPSDVGREALTWINQHVPGDSTIITRDDFWTALRDPAAADGVPERPQPLEGGPGPGHPRRRASERLAEGRLPHHVGAGPEEDFRSADNKIALDALQNAHLVQAGSRPTATTVHVRPAIELWKVDKAGPSERALLADSARYQTASSSGTAPSSIGRAVTSEAQAYAMLRAVWSDDRAGFDRAWGWTKVNLPGRTAC